MNNITFINSRTNSTLIVLRRRAQGFLKIFGLTPLADNENLAILSDAHYSTVARCVTPVDSLPGVPLEKLIKN